MPNMLDLNEADLQTALLAEIHAFLNETRMSRTAFGINALGSPNWLNSVENGRSPNLRNVEKVMTYMRDYRAAIGQKQSEKKGRK